MFPTTLAVGPTRTGYQNAVSSIILGGAVDKVAAAMSKVSSAGVTCLQVVGGTPAKCGAMVPVVIPPYIPQVGVAKFGRERLYKREI